MLDKDKTHRKRPVVIDDHEDELIDHTRGYGEGQKPEDYLEAFKEFINNNMNAIAALRTVCTRPSELTREALKSLKLELDRHDFTEKQLNSAWNEMTNQDIVADIIAFIRQQALGSALISHEQRVKHAFAKLRVNHDFNKTQLDWLKRIEKVLLEESVLDEQHPDNPILFPSPRTGGYWSPDAVSRINRKLLKNAGIEEHVRFHDLRHPYVKHTTKIFSLRLKFFQAQAVPDALRKTHGACQHLREGGTRNSVLRSCNKRLSSWSIPQSKISLILYAISMRLSGYTSTLSMRRSVSSAVSPSELKTALAASCRLSCRVCSSCFCFACANTTA